MNIYNRGIQCMLFYEISIQSNVVETLLLTLYSFHLSHRNVQTHLTQREMEQGLTNKYKEAKNSYEQTLCNVHVLK